MYRMTFRSGDKVSGTESEATFNVDWPMGLDEDVSYMLNAQSFYLDPTYADDGMGNLTDPVGLSLYTMTLEMDSLYRNTFDTARGNVLAGTIAAFKGYAYQGGADYSGNILPVPGFKNRSVTFKIRKADGSAAVELDSNCQWVLTLVIYPAPINYEHGRPTPGNIVRP